MYVTRVLPLLREASASAISCPPPHCLCSLQGSPPTADVRPTIAPNPRPAGNGTPAPASAVSGHIHAAKPPPVPALARQFARRVRLRIQREGCIPPAAESAHRARQQVQQRSWPRFRHLTPFLAKGVVSAKPQQQHLLRWAAASLDTRDKQPSASDGGPFYHPSPPGTF